MIYNSHMYTQTHTHAQRVRKIYNLTRIHAHKHNTTQMYTQIHNTQKERAHSMGEVIEVEPVHRKEKFRNRLRKCKVAQYYH